MKLLFQFLSNDSSYFCLAYLLAFGKPQAIISEDGAKEMKNNQEQSKEEPGHRRPMSKTQSLSLSDENNTSKHQAMRAILTSIRISICFYLVPYMNKILSGEMEVLRMSSRSSNGLSKNADSALEASNGVAPKRGMVLPFTPLAMSFDDVNYYVEMPPVRNIF